MKIDDKHPSLGVNTKMFLAGTFAGVWHANATFLFDFLKVRKQYIKTKPKSYTEEIRHIYRKEGLRGFLKGYQSNLIRDGPGLGFYFMFYEWIKRQMWVSDAYKETATYQNKSKMELSLTLMMCGAATGQAYWLLFYPADYLKTQLQTLPTGSSKSIITLAR